MSDNWSFIENNFKIIFLLSGNILLLNSLEIYRLAQLLVSRYKQVFKKSIRHSFRGINQIKIQLQSKFLLAEFQWLHFMTAVEMIAVRIA